MIKPFKITIEYRFWTKVRKTTDDRCWNWIGRNNF